MELLLDGCPRGRLRNCGAALPQFRMKQSGGSASDRLAGLMLHCSTQSWNRPGNRNAPWDAAQKYRMDADEWLVGHLAKNRGPNLPRVLIGGCVGVAGAGDAEIGFEARALGMLCCTAALVLAGRSRVMGCSGALSPGSCGSRQRSMPHGGSVAFRQIRVADASVGRLDSRLVNARRRCFLS
jgi:hypothetical protein